MDDSCVIPSVGKASYTFASAIQYFAATQCFLSEESLQNAFVNGFTSVFTAISNFTIMSDSCVTPSVGEASHTFASAIQFFAATQCFLSEEILPNAAVKDKEEYDFIIVGAGSAGSVVANRLSEVEKWNVLLIEAGGDQPVESKIPGLASSLAGSEYDWNYQTTFDGYSSKALHNGSVNWTRGKMLGGSSSINYMVYFKGNRHDFQQWYDAGHKEWSPDIVAAYSKKAENLQDANLLRNPDISKNYGHNGPLVINTSNSTLKDFNSGLLKSLNEIGIKNVPDIVTATEWGSGGSDNSRTTAFSGIRASTAQAYLDISTIRRSNLKVLKNSLVTRILIDNNNKAYGVEINLNGTLLTVYASLEVIVSAGSIGTPQLLMLSGLGPKETLNSKNISCNIDLPAVGQHVKDHTVIPVTIYGDAPDKVDETYKHFQAVKYLYEGTGELANNIAADVTALFSTNKSAIFPELQIFPLIYRKQDPSVHSFLSNYNLKSPAIDSIVELSRNYSLYFFVMILVHPYSSGNITLASSNPNDKPIMYSNYFSDTRDVQTIVEGTKYLTAPILNTTFFKSINGFLGRIKWPACDGFELDGYDYWKCISINMAATDFHQMGSARMGKDSTTSVVDSRLRVHNVTGLRIVDASVMPTTVSGNINGVVIMIGERASDLIKEDYRCK